MSIDFIFRKKYDTKLELPDQLGSCVVCTWCIKTQAEAKAKIPCLLIVQISSSLLVAICERSLSIF